MTAPYLVPCLATLRYEFDELSPNRDRTSDGWIGDAAHQATVSDHNPDAQGRVLAIDIDATGPWPVPFGDLMERLRGDERLEYIIWNRRIASRDQGWTWRTYTGTADPHTSHGHISARHDHVGNTSTAPWGIEGTGMDETSIWSERIPLQDPTETAAGTLWDLHLRVPTNLASVLPQVQANGSTLSQLTSMVTTLTAQVTALQAAVAALTPAAPVPPQPGS